MNQQQLELTKLLGDKTLSFGCKVLYKRNRFYYEYVYKDVKKFENNREVHHVRWGNITTVLVDGEFEIIGHKPTIAELHKFLNSVLIDGVRPLDWEQTGVFIIYGYEDTLCDTCNHFYANEGKKRIPYDSSKDLLDQSSETLAQIIELITNTK